MVQYSPCLLGLCYNTNTTHVPGDTFTYALAALTPEHRLIHAAVVRAAVHRRKDPVFLKVRSQILYRCWYTTTAVMPFPRQKIHHDAHHNTAEQLVAIRDGVRA